MTTTTMRNTYSTITKNGTVCIGGYITSYGAIVTDYGDTIGVNSTEHRKDDLIISDNEIESKVSDWRVSW